MVFRAAQVFSNAPIYSGLTWFEIQVSQKFGEHCPAKSW